MGEMSLGQGISTEGPPLLQAGVVSLILSRGNAQEAVDAVRGELHVKETAAGSQC